jgi:hypothetical protein
VAAIYHDDITILSPPRFTADEPDAAYRAAIHNAAVHAALDARQADKAHRPFDSAGRRLPDLPGRAKLGGAPHGSADFDRSH